MKKNFFILFIFTFVISLFTPRGQYELLYAESQNINEEDEAIYFDELSTVSEEDANLVLYDFSSGIVDYLYYENSYWQPRDQISYDSPDNYRDENYIDVTNSILSPYRFIAGLFNSDSPNSGMIGTSFFIGPNLLLTAGHCVINYDFVSSIYVRPAYDDGFSPYGSIPVLKCLVAKEYYDFKREEYINNIYNNNSLYDWAILIVEKSTQLSTFLDGNFGKIAEYNSTGVPAQIIGYPGGYGSMKISNGQITGYDNVLDSNHHFVIFHNCLSAGGSSGSPILVADNGQFVYAVGIHTTNHAGVLIDSFLYRLTNSILADWGVEVRDHYFDVSLHLTSNNGVLNTYNEIDYNCVVKYIIAPKQNEVISLSADGVNYSGNYSLPTYRFYCSGNSSTLGQYEYDYFRVYNSSTQQYKYYQVSNLFSIDERSAKYTCANRSVAGSTISNSAISWNCFLHSGEHIRGTIVYHGLCKNVDMPISWATHNKTVQIDGTTFTFVMAYNNLFLKSNTSFVCGTYDNFFAFGFSS